MREVAERAGVSIGTVSYTLNNPGRVADDTRARVLATMDEMGFVRNEAARQLRSGAASTIGMIVLDIANPFFAALAHASEMIAEESGFTVILGSSDQDARREDRYLDLFEEQRVRGVLVASIAGTTPRMRDLAARGVPVVTFDPYAGDDDFCSVALDGDAAGRAGLSHLADIGRRSIALVGGPAHQLRDRWDAARGEAEARGVTLRLYESDGQTFEEGQRIGHVIASLPASERPDAVFAANDVMAVGIVQTLVTDRIRVPEDVAVVGIDGTHWSENSLVPITTLAQPVDEIARTALRLILDHAADPDHHVHERQLLAPTLVVRASTTVGAPPRKDSPR